MSTSFLATLPAGAPRRLAGAWLSLAISALALSTVCAVVLVAARMPYVGRWLPGVDVFHGALVLHVNLAAVIWFLALAAALWSGLGGSRALRLRWIGFGLACAGVAAITAAPFVGTGAAVLSNYFPVLDNPLFLTGLTWFAAGIVITAACTLWEAPVVLRQRQIGTVLRAGVLLSLLPVLVAGVSWVWSLAAAPQGLAAVEWFDLVFWGAGHTLQFAHVTLMMVAWLALAEAAGVGLAPRGMAVLLAAGTAPVLAVPAIHLAFPVGSGEFRTAFTLLMSYGSWVVAAPLGVLLLLELARSRRVAVPAPGIRASLVLSIVLFVMGCAVGAAIRGDTTLVPAHYHGAIGAVTLAYMGLAMHWLPLFGLRAGGSRLARWQPATYGGGLLLLVLGLTWSGIHSAPRKSLTLQTAGDNLHVFAGMSVAGIGGLTAIAGSALFVLLMWRAWRRAASGGQRQPRARQPMQVKRFRDSRPRAVMLTLAAVVSGGIALAWVGEQVSRPVSQAAADPHVSPGLHADERRAIEVKERFTQGVMMLHAKRYEHAVTAFHRVLELAPEMPEAHVNMGFALIGLERYAAARDFFESATALRPGQANAYYGLAVALEGLRDLPGAMGAMRTFVHLSKPDDPFVRKAEAALWEWRTAAAQPATKSVAVPTGRGAAAEAR